MFCPVRSIKKWKLKAVNSTVLTNTAANVYDLFYLFFRIEFLVLFYRVFFKLTLSGASMCVAVMLKTYYNLQSVSFE